MHSLVETLRWLRHSKRLRQSKYLVRQSKYMGDDLVVLVLLTWVTTWMTLALARRRSIVGVDRDVIDACVIREQSSDRSAGGGSGDVTVTRGHILEDYGMVIGMDVFFHGMPLKFGVRRFRRRAGGV